jgi:D-aminopeptidase
MTDLNIDLKALDALFAEYDTNHMPGIAVGIAHRGVPLYRKGFGLASVELPVALSPSIRMRIGSTTKHFACLALMLLSEEGKVSIKDSVRKHIPELPAFADAISLEQLMQHISGYRCSVDLFMQFTGMGRAAPDATSLNLLAVQEDANFAPGDSWNYCNGGYVLVSEVIERLTGQKLEDVLKARIFDKVGMNDTLLRRLDTDMVPNSAACHIPDMMGGWVRGVFGVSISGEGGTVSTIDDMLRWLAHIRNPVVGSAETWATMQRSGVLNNGLETGYGLGLMSETYRGVQTLHHAGGVMGGGGQMITVPSHALDIIILFNRSGIDVVGLAEKVIDALVPDLAPAPKALETAPISGTWLSRKTGHLITLLDHEGKQMVDFFKSKLPVVDLGDGWIGPASPIFNIRVRAPQGAEGPLEYSEFGNLDTLDPVKAPEGASPPLGRFVSPAADSTVTIEQKGDIVSFVSRTPNGRVDLVLTPLADGVWSASTPDGLMPMGGMVEVDEDGNGFRFSTGRTRRLKFKKAA